VTRLRIGIVLIRLPLLGDVEYREQAFWDQVVVLSARDQLTFAIDAIDKYL
jgi:hypothetical protein